MLVNNLPVDQDKSTATISPRSKPSKRADSKEPGRINKIKWARENKAKA